MKKIPQFVSVWLMFALGYTLLCGLVYVEAQQVVRLSAYQQPVQVTKQLIEALQQGAPASQLMPPAGKDIVKNYSIFATIFDDKGLAQGSSIVVSGKNPILPAGTFSSAKTNGDDRFTWEPQPGARQAVVLVPYTAVTATASGTQESSGYVLAGQPLLESEKLISHLTLLAGVGWAVGLVLGFFLAWLLFKKKSDHEHTADHEAHHEHHHAI